MSNNYRGRERRKDMWYGVRWLWDVSELAGPGIVFEKKKARSVALAAFPSSPPRPDHAIKRPPTKSSPHALQELLRGLFKGCL